MKPSGICHPSTPPVPTPPPPFIHRLSLLPRRTCTRPLGDPHARAVLRAHCLGGFCLVAFLLYPQTKRRSSSARRAGIHLGLVWGPQINLGMVRVSGSQPNPGLGRHERVFVIKDERFCAASIKSACKTLKRESESKFQHSRLELRFMFHDSSSLSSVSFFIFPNAIKQ